MKITKEAINDYVIISDGNVEPWISEILKTQRKIASSLWIKLTLRSKIRILCALSEEGRFVKKNEKPVPKKATFRFALKIVQSQKEDLCSHVAMDLSMLAAEAGESSLAQDFLLDVRPDSPYGAMLKNELGTEYPKVIPFSGKRKDD